LRYFLYILVLLIIVDTADANNTPEQESSSHDTQTKLSASDALDYRSKLEGAVDSQLLALLQVSIDQIVARRRPPESILAANQRTGSLIEELEKILRAKGYYDSHIENRIDQEGRVVTATITIDPGSLYSITVFDFNYTGPGSDDTHLPWSIEGLGDQLGGPAQSEYIVDVELRLLRLLSETGHPLAKIRDRKILVDHSRASMTVELEVSPGIPVKFGSLTVDPIATVDEEYVLGFTTWEQGELFSSKKVDEFRSELMGTGLFLGAKTETPDMPENDDALPIHLTLEERKNKTFGLGAHWSTNEGFGGEIFWEHRNVAGRQENITIKGRIEEVIRELDISFRKPRFLRDDQALLADFALADEDTDAYVGPLANAFLGIERKLPNYWAISPGIWYEKSELEGYQGEREFNMWGLSLRLNRDSSDERLDPTRGSILGLTVSPYALSGDEQLDLVQTIVSGSTYFSLGNEKKMVLANRIKLGSVNGEGSSRLPANRRFYAGGGSSIRGYKLQSVGPVAIDGRPAGGQSLVEISTELRYRFSDVLGGVFFIDGGNVFEDSTPDISEKLSWATGVGVRYYTAVGPIRVDLAFPLDKRETDDKFQLYISVGQAF